MDETISFLDKFRPGGPHLLVAMAPDRPPGPRDVIRVTRAEDAREWLKAHMGKNLYYHGGVAREGVEKKALKTDMESLDYLWVDLDLDGQGTATELAEEKLGLLGRLEEYHLPPTGIKDTGNGYQAVWALEEPIPADDAAEATLRGISKDLGGDHCPNVDRLLRLPGTTNHPGRTKISKGRVRERTRLVGWDGGRRYRAEEFRTSAAPREATISEVLRFDSTDDVPGDLPGKVLVLVEHGHDPDEPEAARNRTRSHGLWAVCCEMVRRGCSDEEVYGVITDPKFGVSRHVYDQSSPERYALRQVARAREVVGKEGEGFIQDDDGRILHRLYHNARVALSKLGLDPRYNELTDRIMISGQQLTDPYLERILEWCQQSFLVTFTDKLMMGALTNVAHENSYHPVKDYLDMLPEWDGKQRLDRWLATYVGAADTPFNQAVGRVLLLAAVRRVRSPGCKFDEMLVLEGIQGLGKSSLFEALLPSMEWFSDQCPLHATGKEFIEATQGKWVMEVAELESFRRVEVERLKAVLSRKVDRARMAYARITEDRPRGFVIVGSTNSSKYLVDPTGNRRFWPVKVGEKLDVEGIRRDRDQIWAEVVAREGESIRLDPSLWGAAAVEQEERREEDPLHDQLAGLLDGLEGRVRNTALLDAMNVPTANRNQALAIRLGRVMESLGWERARSSQFRYWRRGEGGELVASPNGRLRLDNGDGVL